MPVEPVEPAPEEPAIAVVATAVDAAAVEVLAVEVLPPVPIDKGAVVEELAGELGAVCFMGDDTGDLPAFDALGRLRAAGRTTVAVGVASSEQPAGLAEAADVLLSGPHQAAQLLAYLAGTSKLSTGRQ